jgi:hypothetical protein
MEITKRTQFQPGDITASDRRADYEKNPIGRGPRIAVSDREANYETNPIAEHQGAARSDCGGSEILETGTRKIVTDRESINVFTYSRDLGISVFHVENPGRAESKGARGPSIFNGRVVRGGSRRSLRRPGSSEVGKTGAFCPGHPG